MPREPASNLAPANLSECWAENWWDKWCCFAANTLTAKCEMLQKSSKHVLCLDKAQRMSGGSSDTDVKEFTVTPTFRPSELRPVTTVTPVANCPSAWR